MKARIKINPNTLLAMNTFATADIMRPALSSVLLEWDVGDRKAPPILRYVGTEGHVIGIYETAARDQDTFEADKGSVLIPVRDVFMPLLNEARRSKHRKKPLYEPDLFLTIGDEDELEMTLDDAISFRHKPETDAFVYPNWRKVTPEGADVPFPYLPVEYVGVSPRLLVKFVDAALTMGDRTPVVQLRFSGETKQMQVLVKGCYSGDLWGYLMPAMIEKRVKT